MSDPEFQELGDDLTQGNSSSSEERLQMMALALELSLEDSLFIWLIDQKVYAPYNEYVHVI